MPAEDFDALAKEYGVLLARQSERNLPKTAFSKGIMGGKITAKEFEGQNKKKRRQSAVNRAGALLKISQVGEDATMGVNDAMKFAGFNTQERRDKTNQKQVTRHRDKLEKTRLLSAFEVQAADRRKDHLPSEEARPGTVTVVQPVNFVDKKLRQTKDQAHASPTAKAEKKKCKNDLFKKACRLWQAEIEQKEAADREGFKYKPTSTETICGEINRSEEAKAFGIIIAARRLRSYVKAGKAGEPLQKPGEKGRIVMKYYDALCAAVKSYAILTQQAGTKAAVLGPMLAKKINVCVNKKEGFRNRTSRKLYERVERDIADEIQIGIPNRVEQRRNKWSTYSNINLWFTSFKTFLVDMGFALDTPDGDSEITWATADQGSRIGNIDETKITLDSTNPGVGGRPAAGLFHGRLAKAPTQGSHKSSYAATMIGGAFASG